MEKEQFVNLMSQVEADMFHLAFSVLHREQECADAVQEAVVKAYAGRNTLKKQEYFKTWIMRILLSECYALLHGRAGVGCTGGFWRLCAGRISGSV